jgi:serine/threonine protein phosphatase PrpC
VSVRLSQSFADSNTGRKRRHNEDSFVCRPPLFAVADGMGGAQAGEVASGIAADTLRYGTVAPEADGPGRIVELIQTANQRVYQRAHDDAAASGMGTTMTAALLQDGGVVLIGHVGDSRAYVLRDGKLEQLTDDHSLVAELVRRGELSPEEAELHPQRSVITRALGTDPNVDVDTFSFQAQPGDVFLLCSDGLTSMVDIATITELIERNRLDLAAASRALIKAANDRGGEDNITTVLFAVDGDEAGPAAGTPGAQPAPDEEDTLHPEDRVPVVAEPVVAEPPHRTMVMSPEQIQAALRGEDTAEQPPPQEAQAPPEARAPPDEAPPESHAFLEETGSRPATSRRLFAAVVIVVLLGVIVLLLAKGLTR